MEDTEVQTPTTPAPLQAVPLQAVAPPDGFPTIAPLAIIQEGSQAAGVAQVENRIDTRGLQQLRWIKKIVYVCIFLALYAILKKQVPMRV